MTASAEVAEGVAAERSTTGRIVDKVGTYRFGTLPGDVVEVAKHCLLDWLGVALAGSREPVARILLDEVLDQGGKPLATVVGHPQRVAPTQAALVNGAAAHALDYDDVLRTMHGHPSAPVAAAALAVAEQRGATGAGLLTAFVAGVEAAAAVGRTVEPGHHEAGWHATSTLGTFGAAAAAAHLMTLERPQWLAAFGLAGTQAAGLKAVFGTMGKPFHAGRAALGGVLAARLAARGATSGTDIVGAPQGFGAAATPEYRPDALPATFDEDFDIRQVLFKRHAACHLTHSAVEAMLALRASHGVRATDVARITLTLRPVHLTTCCIDTVTTPLEGKFSVRFATALALVRGSAGERDFVPETVADPEIARVARLIDIEVADENGPAGDTVTPVAVRLTDGTVLHERVDVGQPCPPESHDAQAELLTNKFVSLAEPVIGERHTAEAAEAVRHLEDLDDLGPLMELVRGRTGTEPHSSR